MNLRKLDTGLYALDAYLMRSNSAVSDGSWIARIIGRDPKYTLAREFVSREKHQSRSTNDGTQTFGPLKDGEIYEYRQIAVENQSGYSYRKHGGISGFFTIRNGELIELQRIEVMASLDRPYSMSSAEAISSKA
jgi:hypothetical protein